MTKFVVRRTKRQGKTVRETVVKCATTGQAVECARRFMEIDPNSVYAVRDRDYLFPNAADFTDLEDPADLDLPQDVSCSPPAH